MNKALISTLVGVVGSAGIASSMVFNSAPIDNIENNINILKDKVVAYANNEEKLVRKYNELYDEYAKLKKTTKDGNIENYQNIKEKNSELKCEIISLKDNLKKQEKENQQQEDYIKKLEEKIENLESNKINKEKTQSSNELEVSDGEYSIK